MGPLDHGQWGCFELIVRRILEGFAVFRSLLIWLAYRVGLDPRGLFAFHDGRRWRYVDPMAVARALWSIPDFDSTKSRQMINSNVGTLVAQGYQEIAVAVRQAFQVKAAEDGGLTEVECDTLLFMFELYLGELKKNGSPTQTSGQFTVPTVSLPLPDTVPFPTNAESVSG